MFVVSGKAIAGNELYFSGLRDVFLSDTKYIVSAQLFNALEDTEKTVEWYKVRGEKFQARELSPAEYSNIKFEIARLTAVKSSLCDLMDGIQSGRELSVLPR